LRIPLPASPIWPYWNTRDMPNATVDDTVWPGLPMVSSRWPTIRPTDLGPRCTPDRGTRADGPQSVRVTWSARQTPPACKPLMQLRAIYRPIFARLLVSRRHRRRDRRTICRRWAPGASLSSGADVIVIMSIGCCTILL